MSKKDDGGRRQREQARDRDGEPWVPPQSPLPSEWTRNNSRFGYQLGKLGWVGVLIVIVIVFVLLSGPLSMLFDAIGGLVGL